MRIRAFLSIFAAGLSINVLCVGTAFAYLDPGSGSAILQGILGALAAIGVVLKLYWHRFLRLLGIRKKSDNITANAESNDSNNNG